MSRWRVDYLGKRSQHLGTIEAHDEREAIQKAAETFHVTPARRNKLVMTRLDAEGDR